MNEETRLFIDLLCYSAINHEKEKPGTIEYCLRSLMNDMDKYSFELYNVLIQNSIDLNEYQQKTGVYFRREWNPANSLFFKFGDLELIDSLQKKAREVDITDPNGMDEFKAFYQKLMKPAYDSQYPDKMRSDSLAVIEQDLYGSEGMTKLVDFAKQWLGNH